jgi:transposase
MGLLEIREVLRHWLGGRAKKAISRRLGIDVKTVRKYVLAAEACGVTIGARAPTARALSAVADRVLSQRRGRPRGAGWDLCSRHREGIRTLLEGGIRPTEIRIALARCGVRVSVSTLYRFVVAELAHHTRSASIDGRTPEEREPVKAIAPVSRGQSALSIQGKGGEAAGSPMLRLMKRHEIQVLLSAGHSQEQVAQLAGVSVSSVRRVGKEEPVEHRDDAAEHAKRRIGRPSILKTVRELVEDALTDRPDLDVVQILRRARVQGYRGGDSAFYELVAALRRRGDGLVPPGKVPAESGGDPPSGSRPEASGNELPQPEASEDSSSDCTTVPPNRSGRTASSYSFRLEYVEDKPLPRLRDAGKGPVLNEWYRDFAISERSSLEQLSSVILGILGWDPNHLYEFRIGGRLYAHMGEDSLVVEMKEQGVSCDVPLQLLALAQGDTFTYLFDFGDCRTFRLTVLAIEPPREKQLPVLLTYRGNDIIQYPRSLRKTALRSAQNKPPSIGSLVRSGGRETVRFVRGADRDTLIQWRKSNDKRLWQKAVAILENWSLPLEDIAKKIEKSPSQVRSWIKAFNQHGLEGLSRKKRVLSEEHRTRLELKRRRIIETLHERPRAYGINRSNWNLRALATAYAQQHGEAISTSTVSRLVRDSGYVMKKARRVLSSPDPRYREKVELLLQTLRNLEAGDLFFFVDELGPLRVKKYGGRAYVPRNETQTFPQSQADRGSITMAGALSATTNQVTWIYGSSKDSSAMIDLIEILFNQHPAASRLYLTWDAASWHSSSLLVEWLDGFNAETKRSGGGPVIELVPLPASAQFLDVIEAVFSGMKRAVIHHSDYRGPVEMKDAISLHFVERNTYFRENPRRAGQKIWELDFFADRETIRSGNYREW